AAAGGVPDRAADIQPHRRRRHPVVRRHHAFRFVGRPRRVCRPRSACGWHRRRVLRNAEDRARAKGRRVTELWERDAYELADGVRNGELKSTELLDTFLERVEKFDAVLNAFGYRDIDRARARAAAIDDAVARGEDPGVWAGVPMGVKELAQVEG